SNAEFTSALAAAVHRPAVMIVPVPALKLAVGGVSSDILSSARVLPRRLLDAGYQFRHPGIAGALAAELSGGSPGPAPAWPTAGLPRRRPPSRHACGDRPRAVQRLGVCRVYLQVVGDALVHQCCLGCGHPDDPIAPGDLAGFGDRAVTPDTDPQHPQRVKRVLPPPLGRRTTEKGLIHDDPGTGTRDRGDPVDPR